MDKIEIELKINNAADEFFESVKDEVEKENLALRYAMNSIDSIEFLLVLEEKFDIEFDEDHFNISFLQDKSKIVDYIYEVMES